MAKSQKRAAITVDAVSGFAIVGLVVVRQIARMPAWVFYSWLALIAATVSVAVWVHLKRG